MTLCNYCLFASQCDIAATYCRLTPRQVVVVRSDLLKTVTPKQLAQAKWRAANLERVRAYDRERYAANSEVKNRRSMDYQRRHPQKKAAANARYRAKHRTRLNEYRRNWRAQRRNDDHKRDSARHLC